MKTENLLNSIAGGTVPPLSATTGSALVPNPPPQVNMVEYWKLKFERLRWPQAGIFFMVPEDDEPNTRDWVMIHQETMRKLPILLDVGESIGKCRDFFASVMPQAEILLPNVRMTHTEK